MISRRSLIVAVPATLVLARTLPAWAATRGADPFSLGVACGDPSPDGFVIWTRIAPEPMAEDGLGGARGSIRVRWAVAEDEAMRRVVASGETRADESAAHAVHVEVSGLRPNRPYWYRFTAAGAQSRTGRARTAPAPDQALDRLKLTFTSCAHYELGYFAAYRHMAAEDADLTLFLGDYIYEFTYANRATAVRWHGGETASDLAEYRRRFACYRTDADLQTLHASAPCLVTWDDHEVENDYAGALSANPAVTPQAFLQRRAAAYRAFYEHMPIRRTRLRDAFLPIYKTVRYGRLAEFYVLDTRQYRSPPGCTAETSRLGRVAPRDCPGRQDPSRSMLGQGQEAWLYGRFAQAGARWNLMAQSLLAATVLQKGNDGIKGAWTDGWDGYPATRDRMIAAMRNTGLTNPVILSGDIHSFWANELKADVLDPTSATVATEFVTAAVSANPPNAASFTEVSADNPHVRFMDVTRHGYVSMELTPDSLQARLRAISERTDPNASVETLRSFTVASGRPGIQPA